MERQTTRVWTGMGCVVASVVFAACFSFAQQKRPITARDCVTVRDLQYDSSTVRSTIKISPDGSRVAYLVRSPNLQTNENEIELYVRTLPTDRAGSSKPLLVGNLSAMRWLGDGRTLTVLMKNHDRHTVERVDVLTGAHQPLFQTDDDMVEYSTDLDGKTLVYAINAPTTKLNGLTAQQIASGYLIPFQKTASALWPKRRVFLVRSTATGWTTPASIAIRSPLSQEVQTDLTHAGNSDLQLTLSPDGKQLLLSYWDLSETMPEGWLNSGRMQFRRGAGVVQAFKLLVLHDLGTGQTTTAPLQTPWAFSAPLWSSDSKSFVVVAEPPVGSLLEQQNVATHVVGHSAGGHLFWVKPSTGEVEDIARKLSYPWGGPLFWDDGGSLLVQVKSMETISRYSRTNGEWSETASWRVPLERLGTQLATNGKYVIGEYDDTTIPPQLFLYRFGDEEVRVFAKLNPQFDELTISQPQEVHWQTSTGFNASGLLLMPAGYQEGTKYPLVIQTKPFGRFFVCSFGDFPSFAPQPVASAGIMYLGQVDTKDSTQQEQDYFPKGYPGYQGVGGIAEAAFAMDLWDSAIKVLHKQGLVDDTKVGIIGFSRTGWYTEFILSHSTTHYRAATVADNVQYSLGEYWLPRNTGTFKTYEATYGGPPYGATLKNWLDYSISFNLDKVHTPLLMEQMGAGKAYDDPSAPPMGLAESFEVFSGLSRLKKPVELYYYPNAEHTPDSPQARLATMQRNVDWYRFWLKDEERLDPDDAEQFVRWRGLRELQRDNDKEAALESSAHSLSQQSDR